MHSLAYADDLAMLSLTAEDLQLMLKTLHSYSSKRKLTVNVDKSKVVRFSSGGKLSKTTWKYGDETMEKVNRFKYLGFMSQINGSFSSHIEQMYYVIFS